MHQTELNTLRMCRGCGPQYEVTEQQIDRILLAPMFQDMNIVVDDKLYVERLSHCNRCEYLHNQQTCQLCGCYVRVSAKYKSKGCPNVRERKWLPIG